MNKYSDFQRGSLSSRHFPLVKIRTSSDASEFTQEELFPQINHYMTPRISKFTIAENEKVIYSSNNYLNRKEEKNENIVHKPSQKSCDFQSILKNIDMITSQKDAVNHKTLNEGNIEKFSIPTKEVKYFKIESKDRRSPLKINIRRSYGKLRVFISRTTEKPTSLNNDKLFTEDSIVFLDHNQSFQCSFIYISIESITSVEFSIVFSFGCSKNIPSFPEHPIQRKKTLSLEYEELCKSEVKRTELSNKVDEILKQRKFKQLKQCNSKNFLVINKNPSSLIPVKSESHLNLRIAEVNKRKQEIYNEKKTQKLEKLSRKSRRISADVVRIIEKNKMISQNKIKRFWLGLICFCKAADSMQLLISKRKSIKVNGLRRTTHARTIQKAIQGLLFRNSIKDKVLIHAKNNLFLFNSVLIYEKYILENNIVDSIKFSSKVLSTAFTFMTFFRKVELIKKALKEYVGRNKNNINQIKNLWNQILNFFIVKKSNDEVSKYIKITQDIRDDTVTRYYLKKKSLYLNRFKELNRSTTLYKIVRKGTKAMKLPTFEYMPSKVEIANLIEHTAHTINK